MGFRVSALGPWLFRLLFNFMAPHHSDSRDQLGVRTSDQALQQTMVLETYVPPSQSLTWRVQRDFYVERGLKAWTDDLVPSYITNIPFIAEIYAQIVASFISDCVSLSQRDSRQLSPDNPLRILELGA